jgi:GTP 3',8-cyclase
MLYDRFGRKIEYLRISVTDRCNLRCEYCIPPDGVRLVSHDDILRFEEIVAFVETAVLHGIKKLRITGGEPLLRRGIVDLVAMFAQIGGIDDLAMTTNGTILEKFAPVLKRAGLHRVNISLDTLDAEKFRNSTKGGNIQDVLDGIFAAKNAGLAPLKLNCVVEQNACEPDALEVAEFGGRYGFEVRFIKKMDILKGIFHIVDGGTGGNCMICNRLRLTSDGLVKPCLFSDIAFSVRELGAEKALLAAVAAKPEFGKLGSHNCFYNIGG